MYAYAYVREGPWYGSFDSRIEAEETGRALRNERNRREGKPQVFVMMWTARILKLSIGDLVRGGPLLNLLKDQSDYRFRTDNVEEEKLHALEDEVGQVIDRWAGSHSIQQFFERYVEREPGFYCIDYEMARSASKGGNQRYKADAPVENETHYMTLWGRIVRFLGRKKREDLQGVSLDARIETMSRAMQVWDAEFPLPGLRQYERRLKEIKSVLGSPWPDLGVLPPDHDEEGNYVYVSDDNLTEDQRINRSSYRLLQREQRWLKQRLTAIYRAREWARAEARERRSRSATQASTGAKSK